MKKILYLLLLNISLISFSQKADITSAIIALDNQKDLASAKKWIDVAAQKIESGSTLKAKMLSKYYHYKGLIYLKTFQSSDSTSEERFDLLNVATESFLLDSKLEKSNFAKKSKTQLNICAYLYQDGAYKDYEKKNYLLALDKFSEAIRINSSPVIGLIDTFNMYNASLMAFQSNNFEASASWAKKLIQLNSNDERFHIRLISAYSEIGDLELQLNAIKAARLAVPKSKEIIFEEVNYYLASGNNDLLLESLDNAVQSDENNPILHLVLGNTYSQLNNFDKAEFSFKKAIEIDLEYFDAHNNLASLYLDQTIDLIEKKNALNYKQESLFKKYKNNINALYNKALPHLESCLRIAPQNTAIASALKEIYYKLDNAKSSLSMKKLNELPESEKDAFVKEFFNQ